MRNLRITNVIPKHLESISAKLVEMGVDVIEEDNYVIVSRRGPLDRVNIKKHSRILDFRLTFSLRFVFLCVLPTELSYLNESVWDNRFRYVSELKRMGANIRVNGRTAIIEGGKPPSALQL